MEAIKFSELPTGDRMTLQDEDGVPIIANGENRLLSWGRLKDQLAKQTHTDTVKNGETKVPTAAAVEQRVGECEDNLRSDLTTLSEVANQAREKASNAALAASNAQTTADGAKADAARFESELDGKISAITTAQGQLRTELNTELTKVSSGVADMSERVGSIESKIENGEIGGEEVDLTPITERLTDLETTNNAQDTSISKLQETANSHATNISEINSNLSPSIECTEYAITFADADHYQLETKSYNTNSSARSINEYIKLNNDNTATLWEYCKYLEHSLESLSDAYSRAIEVLDTIDSEVASTNTRCSQLNNNVNKLLNEISVQLEQIA